MTAADTVTGPAKAARQLIQYWGITSDGRSIKGITEVSPAAFAEEMFKACWRSLVITDTAGKELGGIVGNGNGRRAWWAE